MTTKLAGGVSGSVSLARTPGAGGLTVPPSFTANVSATAVGGSLTGTTVTVLVAVLLAAAPSKALKVITRGVAVGLSPVC